MNVSCSKDSLETGDFAMSGPIARSLLLNCKSINVISLRLYQWKNLLGNTSADQAARIVFVLVEMRMLKKVFKNSGCIE